MSSSTFRFRITLSRRVHLRGQAVERDVFTQWLWEEFGGDRGLVGIHEGTMLAADAAQSGQETESWTLDAGEAPRERDWVNDQDEITAELYFETREQAEAARTELGELTKSALGEVEEQEPQDWDAQWKASFLGSVDGVPVPPDWRILPPWVEKKFPGERIIRINPGAGFGTGTHETTQLCLEAIARIAKVRPLSGGRPVLDFGSGSGILSVGAALLGARVDGVEIDPLAIDNAVENAKLNGVEQAITFEKHLGAADRKFDLVIANILRPVLLEFSSKLVDRLVPGGAVVLSGLVDGDVREVRERYHSLLKTREPSRADPVVSERGDWRSIVWGPGRTEK